MNRVIFGLLASAVTFAICFATGYLMDYPSGATAAVALLPAVGTFATLTVASRRGEPSATRKRNTFLLAGVLFAAFGTMHLLEPYVVEPEDLSWRGTSVILYILSALQILLALRYRREAE